MAYKNRSIEKIEERMQNIEEDSMRYEILNSVKKFKTSWIELGQSLYSVWKDKLYKAWGYSKFDFYTAKEIGIKKQTAMKLLKSYYFLEKEEPRFLDKNYVDGANATQVPTAEAVDILRKAKYKKTLDHDDYRMIKEKLFDKGKDAGEVKKDLTQLIKEREELDPDEAREKRKEATIKRMLSILKNLKRDMEVLKLLPVNLVKETENLIKNLEREIS